MLDYRDIGPDLAAGKDQAAAAKARRLLTAADGLTFAPGDDVPIEPVVFSSAEYERHAAVAKRFGSLLQKAAWSNGRDPAALRDALVKDRGRHELLTTDAAMERTWASCMFRVDAVISAGTLKVLESNIGGAIGGVNLAHVLTSQYRQELADVHGRVHFDDPFDARRLLYEDACRWMGGPPSVALLATLREVLYAQPAYWSVETDFMARHGVEAVFQEPEQLAGARGRFPVALRHFMPEEWTEMGIDLGLVRKAMDEGTLMLAPESAFLLQNKKLLAWLSCRSAEIDADDLAFLEAHLPWTRVVAATEVDFHGRTWYLPELLRRHQAEFVLKPATGYCGYGVLVGRFASRGQWLEGVCRALAVDEEFIVQEYAEPDPAHVAVFNREEGTARRAKAIPVVAFMVFGGRNAGSHVRLATGTSNGVINLAQGASVTVAGWHDG